MRMGVVVVAALGLLGCGKSKSGRLTKKNEPELNVERLYQGAKAYWMENHAFPPSEVATPPEGSCCQGGGVSRCLPQMALWQSPTWQALNFAMEDPHYFSYAFTADEKSFTVTATGDLDCDTVLSKYQAVGTVGPDGNIQGPALSVEQRLE